MENKMKELFAVSEMRLMLFRIIAVGVFFKVLFPLTPILEVFFFLGIIFFLDMVQEGFVPTASERVLFSEAQQEYDGLKLWNCVFLGMAIGRVFLEFENYGG